METDIRKGKDMNITLKSIHIENFKGITNKDLVFNAKNNSIKGANGTGKTTIVDAFLWLLFDKNSQYATDFEIRTLDADGNPVHMTDITVSAVVDFDGVEHELKKIQRENWVKQRGAETSVFKGNVNTFEIDGYPKSLAEYKAFIENIVAEDKFKIITNPTYFANMKWKEQREILMKFATTESNADMAKHLGGYDEILKELEIAPSTDDIIKKYKNTKKSLETTLIELPVRIDEVSKTKVDYDLSELETEKAEIENKIAQAKSSQDGNVETLKGELVDAQLNVSNFKVKTNADNTTKRHNLYEKILDASSAQKLAIRNSEENENEIKILTKNLESDESIFKQLGNDYYAKSEEKFDLEKWEYDPNSEKCAMCGQVLPMNRVELIRKEFEERKAKAMDSFESMKKVELETLINRGNEYKKKVSDDKSQIKAHEDKRVELKVAIETATTEIETLKKEYDATPDTVDLTDNAEYTALTDKVNDLVEKIKVAEEKQKENALSATGFESDLAVVNSKIAQALNNSKIDERIEELKAEQRNVSQKIADCEKVLYLVEQFVKAKLNIISTAINSKFGFVKFKLFDTAINGGISECCELTVNGVPYSSLNSACKTQAGLDIINTFCDTYGVVAPVFIDNRESCTWIPEMSAQIISLYVDPSYKTMTMENN